MFHDNIHFYYVKDLKVVLVTKKKEKKWKYAMSTESWYDECNNDIDNSDNRYRNDNDHTEDNFDTVDDTKP